MKILVIEDNEKHIKSAYETLTGHDLTICNNCDDAEKIFNKHEFKKNPETKYDAVLCDLMMPAGSSAQNENGRKYVGLEMAVGWSFALRAVLCGAKYVGVITDTNHHDHPASALLDSHCWHIYNVDGAKLFITNKPGFLLENSDEIEHSEGKNWGKLLEHIIEN